MIDLHSHILPGIDDGARTIADSREIARGAVADGITAIAATPHVRGDYPTTVESMRAGVEELRGDFEREGIPLRLLTGGELDLPYMKAMSADDVAGFTLAGNGRYLLVETPYVGWPLDLEETILELSVGGLVPVIAHPERNHLVQAKPAWVESAVRAGALVQVTAASLEGRLGRSSKACAEKLLSLGLVHLLASDAHTAAVRAGGIGAAARGLGDMGLARYLTEEAPAAIAAGEDVAKPPRRRRKRLRFV